MTDTEQREAARQFANKWKAGGNEKKIADNINPYLVPADNVFIEKRSQPIADVQPMVYGIML